MIHYVPYKSVMWKLKATSTEIGLFRGVGDILCPAVKTRKMNNICIFIDYGVFTE